MTPFVRVYEALCSAGIPGTYVAYQEGKAPPLPWFTYMERRGGEVFASDTNYSKVQHFRAELYQRENDPELRESFEAAVASLGPYKSYTTWIPTEQCLMTSYDFSVPHYNE